MWVGILQSIEGPNGTEGRKRKTPPPFSYLIVSDRTFLLIFYFSSTRIHTIRTPDSQAYRLGQNSITGFPSFTPCRQEIVEFLSLHK